MEKTMMTRETELKSVPAAWMGAERITLWHGPNGEPVSIVLYPTVYDGQENPFIEIEIEDIPEIIDWLDEIYREHT